MSSDRIETLKSLQQRIREATGADRELDYAIENALGKLPLGHSRPYTASLDACVSLLNAVLPGWKWSVSDNRYDPVRGKAFASVQTPVGYDGPTPWPEGYGHHVSASHALLLAIISAAIAQLEARERTASGSEG